MSYHSHLEKAKKCLIAGRLSEMRTWLRRTEPIVASEEQALEVRCQMLRCCLLTGQYEQGEKIRQDMEHRWPGMSSVTALREALFAVAGWGPFPADLGQPDVFALIHILACDEPLAPETALKLLGDWSRHLPRHPFWLNDLAVKPFSKDILASLGERVLPPNAEAALAEIWYGQGGTGEYPRRAALEENAGETGFAFLPAYLDLLGAIQQENIPAALSASDWLFTKADEGKWLWLRALDLIRHFGDPATMDQTPLRLRIARRTLINLGPISDMGTVLEDYHPLIMAFTRTVSRCLPSLPKPSASAGQIDEEVPALAEAMNALEELFSLSNSVSSAPWSSSPGACLMVERLLLACREKDLTAAPAFPVLEALQSFVQSAVRFAPEAAACWLALPPVWHAEQAYWPLLLAALPFAPAEAALACAAILRQQKMPFARIWEALPPGARVSLFMDEPEPSGLAALESLPDDVLHGRWADLVVTIWMLGSQKLGKAERAAQGVILDRLMACLDIPQIPPLSKKTLSDIAERVSARPASNAPESTFLCRLALRLADDQSWDASTRILEQVGEAGAGLRGTVSARRWLATGQKEAHQPQWWLTSSDPWSEMASVWDHLLELCPACLSETNPLRDSQPELTAAVDALAAWRAESLASEKPKPFPATTLFDALIEPWQFLRSLRSWRLLTSAADVLPPIAGLTPEPERPLLALLHLARYGVDAPALRVVLSSLLAWDSPPALALDLLEMAVSATASHTALLKDLRGWMQTETLDRLRPSLTSDQIVRLEALEEALPLALVSPEARALVCLDQTQSDEKTIRLALQKVKAEDLVLDGVWDQMGQFVNGPHFCAWSIPQWELVREWRIHAAAQGVKFKARVLGQVAEAHRPLLSRLFFEPLHPALLDAGNILRDDDVGNRFEWGFDCLTQLWTCLESRGCYPIITCADSSEYQYQEKNHGPEAKRRFNDLIREGFIDCRAGYVGEERIADYRLLRRIQKELWQENALIVTNDYYSKPSDKGGWRHVFSWLTDAAFQKMQATFRPDDGQWLLRLPNGQELPF